jgi:hypothetical protein
MRWWGASGMGDQVLRIADAVLGLFWLWQLIVTIRTGLIFGRAHNVPEQEQRPKQYWFVVLLFAVMTVHFLGLAIAGQHRGG